MDRILSYILILDNEIIKINLKRNSCTFIDEDYIWLTENIYCMIDLKISYDRVSHRCYMIYEININYLVLEIEKFDL